ncbi:hypothetical protein C4546_03010 [Candidatus Parcubacteria bacterium]|jgi:hypothetical protein|nr:MAG: hypothetical protein C4546_03010 [Candidatus Parcubacteria bacterium]
MINFLQYFRKKINTTQKWIRVVILVIFALIFFWIAEENVAFFGVHKIVVKNFLNLPGSVLLTPGYEVGVLDTGDGLAARPFRSRSELQVTLPRGFETMDVKAEVRMDTYSQLTLGGVVQTGMEADNLTVINPRALEDGFTQIPLEGGNILLKDAQINSSADFFKNFFEFKKIIGIGPAPLDLVPMPDFKPELKALSVTLPLRSSFDLNVYLNQESKSIKFIKQDLNYQPGPDSLTLTLKKGHKRILTKTISDNELTNGSKGQPREIFVELPNLEPGLYSFLFRPNNEDSVVKNLEIFGAEPKLTGNIFLGPVSKTFALFTACNKIQVEAVKNSGFQDVFFNNRKIYINKAKESFNLSTSEKLDFYKIEWHRGDIAIRSDCGFYLQTDLPFRNELNKYFKNVTVVSQLNKELLEEADAVLNSFSEAKFRKDHFIVKKTFDLKELAANGKTFSFYLETPNLNSRAGGFLYIKRLEFIARRPAFSLSDIPKAFKAVFK